MIITTDTTGHEKLLVLKDGAPLGCVTKIDTADKFFERTDEHGVISAGYYDRLALSLETDREIIEAIVPAFSTNYSQEDIDQLEESLIDMHSRMENAEAKTDDAMACIELLTGALTETIEALRCRLPDNKFSDERIETWEVAIDVASKIYVPGKYSLPEDTE